MADDFKEVSQGLESILTSAANGISALCRMLGLGLWQLKKPRKLLPVLVVAVGGVIAGLFVPTHLWLFIVLPPLLLMLGYGYMRSSEIQLYRKAFLDVGFKGKDGKAPYLISKCDLGSHRTGYYFRSNISLHQWKQQQSALQTALDCIILTFENGKSQKIVHLTTIPAGMELSKMVEWRDDCMNDKKSVIVLGESIAGAVFLDFNGTPHLLVAGSTGSGKSVLIRSIVYQCVVKDHKVYLMDFKRGVEFGKAYDDFCEVIMDKSRAVELLAELVRENRDRLDAFRRRGIKNLDEYNTLNQGDPLQRIVVFIDELAILLIPTKEHGDKELTAQATDCLENIAILGRAAGINLVLGIQRPDANTVTGQIKSNVSGRVCGHFADPAPSLIVLNNTRANDIDSEIKGRFMFQDGKETIEMQGYYQKEEQVINGIVTSRAEYYAAKATTPIAPKLTLIETPGKASRKAVAFTENKLDFGYDKEDLS